MMVSSLSANMPEILLIRPKSFSDIRGRFVETYNLERYIKAGIPRLFVQDNLSVSKCFVVRGLHWQNSPYDQGKLVSVVKGAVFDVVVDIRKGSPTFGKWVCAGLDDQSHEQLYIPPGFAHGFQAVTDEAVFCYKCTDTYDKNSEASLRWNDPTIDIHWPYPTRAIVSEKDYQAPLLSEL